MKTAISTIEQPEKRCLACKKRLIGETVPYCYRCRLEGRNIAGAAVVFGGFVLGKLITGGSPDDGEDNSDDEG